MKSFFAIVIALSLGGSVASAAPAKGRSLFVSPSGSDEALGTAEFPWRTIQKACDEVRPGDNVIVRAGLYNEQLFIERGGNAELGWVTLQAEGKAVITALGLNESNVIYIEDKSFIRIVGFEIRDLQTTDGSGIRVEGSGSNYEFRNNTIHGIRGKNAMGITFYGTDDETPLSRIVVDGNEIHDCDAAPSEALTLNGNVTEFQVTNNHVHDIRGVGIDFIGGEDGIVDDKTKVARNGICRGNRVERVRAPYGGGYGPGIYVDGGSEILVEGNRVSECDLGIEVGAENPGVTVAGITVTSNILTGNDKAGFVIGGYDKKRGRVHGCRILNNLIRDNTSHKKAEAEIWIQWADQNTFRNNIVIGRAGATKPLLYSENKDQPNDFDFNLWHSPEPSADSPLFVWAGKEYATFEAYSDATGLDRRSYPVDPKLAADGIHLTDDSPAIDAGDPEMKFEEGAKDIDGEPRKKGARVDLGVDEN